MHRVEALGEVVGELEIEVGVDAVVAAEDLPNRRGGVGAPAPSRARFSFQVDDRFELLFGMRSLLRWRCAIEVPS